jgi:hypothetical protein
MTFAPNNEWNTVYGGPGSSIHGNSYWSSQVIKSILKTKIRKDKIKKIFNVDREEK